MRVGFRDGRLIRGRKSGRKIGIVSTIYAARSLFLWGFSMECARRKFRGVCRYISGWDLSRLLQSVKLWCMVDGDKCIGRRRGGAFRFFFFFSE